MPHGIHFYSDQGTQVGGIQPGEGNVIVGAGWGIWLGGRDGPTRGVRIQGNLIGTLDGERTWGNAWGIYVEGNDGHQAQEVQIGGSEPEAGNTVSGNAEDGIVIVGPGARLIRVEGNHIGTSSNGLDPLGNAKNGVRIAAGASDNQVLDNLISANGHTGVLIQDTTTTANVLLGNRIGTDETGQLDFGNRIMGVWIIGAPDNQIGGLEPGQGNLISGNDVNGVVIGLPAATGNLVLGNTIEANALGVHLFSAHGNRVEGNVLSRNVVGLDISGAEATAISSVATDDANLPMVSSSTTRPATCFQQHDRRNGLAAPPAGLVLPARAEG
jgi:titin